MGSHASSETIVELWYSNPKTGVYFSFDFEAKAPESPDDGPDIPDGYFDSGLSFNSNYNRPSYFAFEAMPIVETSLPNLAWVWPTPRET